jgi:hypothetical protein
MAVPDPEKPLLNNSQRDPLVPGDQAKKEILRDVICFTKDFVALP